MVFNADTYGSPRYRKYPGEPSFDRPFASDPTTLMQAPHKQVIKQKKSHLWFVDISMIFPILIITCWQGPCNVPM